MKDICPICESKSNAELIKKREVLNIRGEDIEVEVEVYRCSECREEILGSNSTDPFEQAYRVYRKNHCLLQPEEIKTIRKKYGLTQNELSKILGWGLATLSRYENGALQDEAHDKILRLIDDPSNLLKLILKSPQVFDDERRAHIIKDLKNQELQSFSFENLYEELFSKYDADENSGFTKFNMDKVLNAILYFCTEGEFKTKVNKLLFYLDFKHFRDYTTAVSGLRYAHGYYGPIPEKYDYFYAFLIERGSLNPKEYTCDCSPDIVGEILQSTKRPDLSIFLETELMELAYIKKHFKNFTSNKIQKYSHEERGYKETSNGDYISYDYAQYLRL